MTNIPYDLVVFGATSFVGQILTRELVQHLNEHHKSLRWAIAGRSNSKLQKLKASLGEAGQAIPILIADASDDDELNDLCSQTRVVVSTVGPYALYGEPLVRACVKNGTDYCDLTGETQWIKKMIDRYQSQAQQSGARIVHCCGFDSVPSDMGVYFLQKQAQQAFQQPATEVKMGVKVLKGGVSGGTIASMLNIVQEAAHDPLLRKDLSNPYILCPKNYHHQQKQTSIKTAYYDQDFQAWAAPFVMAAINERVVHRSNALSNDQYGQNFRYHEQTLTGQGIKGRIRAITMVAGLGAFVVGAASKPVSKLMENHLLSKIGEGPTLEQQANGRFDLRFIGRTDQGQVIRIKVTGDRDPGYGATGKMLAQAALSLSIDHETKDNHSKQGGFWTPATVFDERFIERLTRYAGIQFEVI